MNRRHLTNFQIFLLCTVLYTTKTFAENIENDPIANNEACKKDIQALQQLCELRDEDLVNNWAVLGCVDSLPPEKQITQECDNHIWKFKLEVTRQDVFLDQAKEICGNDIDVCQEEKSSEPGHLLACLVEKKQLTKSVQCSKFLGQVENIIFSDYRIISNFMKACDVDITSLNCGKARKGIEDRHSQGGTIRCLSENMEHVKPSCRKEILSVAEMQSNDFHLDRALYLACSQDRENICPHVQPGEGRVYKCLMKNKLSASKPCQEELTRRQKLVAEDFRADRSLAKACNDEIKRYTCTENIKDGDKHTVQLAHVLMCLENQMRDDKEMSDLCMNEVSDIRRELMEDYSITPEIVAHCDREIEHYCPGAKKQKNGKTIHCLMKAAIDHDKEKQSANDANKNDFSQNCLQAVDQLVRESQVITDWKVDPVLEDACEEVVATACNPKLGNDAVMSCLMEELSKESEHMTTSCSEVLMQVHYFLAREVIIDENLYKACNKNAKELCNGADNWHNVEHDPSNKLVFPCLVRNLYAEDEEDEDDEDKDAYKNSSTKLSEDCTHEVERTLGQRAMSVQLHPEIEGVCRSFLHTYCTTHVKAGEEFECLQDNISNLNGECLNIVSKYTSIEARNPFLHPIISKACNNLINRKCGLEAKAQDGSGVMDCLLRHKLEHPLGSKGAMNTKCRTVVEHWQILTLQDWKFSFKFKEACTDDIRQHCTNPRPKKKQDIMGCLLMVVANDTVEETKHRIKKACRAELRFELLQKHSNIKLDPELQSACETEMQNHCQDEQDAEDGGLECLKSIKHKLLSQACRRKLLKEEMEESMDNDVDFALMRGCKREIKEHCSDIDSKDVLTCLKDFSDDSNFDPKCLKIIEKRTVQHSKDIRLNPRLFKYCKKDAYKLCNNAKMNGDDFIEGHVMACLKHQAIQKHSKLSAKCKKEVMGTILDTAHIVDADPELLENCPNSLVHCKNEPNMDTDVKVNECLKDLFKRKALMDGENCAKHLAEVIEGTGADIHTDPILHAACAVDLRKFCRDIPQGEGRMFACLIQASKVESYSLEPDCKEVLSKRMEMYDMAVKVAPLESVQELYQNVMKSPHRNYMLSAGMMFIGAIFVFGLCFGRVTKRLHSEIKNR